jgi:uncharacterized protein YjbI with pentapeptide repeats/WD40 repeat protein
MKSQDILEQFDSLEQFEDAQDFLAAFQNGRRNFSGINITNADLSGANLAGVKLHKANLRGTNLSGADLTEADLTSADLQNVNLTHSILRHANLKGCDLQQATLKEVDWYQVNLSWANLTQQDLSEANLQGVNFRGANLSQANLSKANLSEAQLDATNLQSAILASANLQLAYLHYTDLTQANLRQADLTEADLKGAVLVRADLRGAEFSQAKELQLDGAIVGNLAQDINPILHLELETRGTSFAFSPDSQTLAYIGRDHTITLVDSNTGEQSLKIDIQPEAVVSVMFRPDGQKIEESFYVNEFKFWNPSTGQLIRDLKNHSANFTALALNGNADVISMVGTGEPFELFDMGHETRTLRGYSSGIQTQAHSPDGRFTARSGPDLGYDIELIDRQTNQPILKLSGHVETVQSLAFSPDSQTLASYSAEDFKIWVVGSPNPILSLGTSQLSVFPFVGFTQLDSEERPVLITSHCFCEFKYRDASPMHRRAFDFDGSGHPVNDSMLNPINWNARGGGTIAFSSFALSADRTVAARCLDEQPIQIWNLLTGQEFATVKSDSGGDSLALNSTGNLLGFGDGHDFKVWDIPTNSLVQIFAGHSDDIQSIAFSPDNQLVASGGWDSTIKVWRLEPNSEPVTFKIDSCAMALAFSPVESILASLSKDGIIQFWDLETMDEIQHLKGHKSVGANIAFSPDGQYLASCDRNSTRLWKLERNA